MQDFWLYIKLGLEHVLDPNAYDHILFLAALAVPLTFKSWKHVVLLATVFTITHCTSLAFSVYEVYTVDVALIEFLIPVTIALTALFNLYQVVLRRDHIKLEFHMLATAFFGLVHGFGFSNYFRLFMAEEEHKLVPLLGFATGIELSQVTVIFVVLAITYLFRNLLGLKATLFVGIASILILINTIPMLLETFPK